MKLSRLKKLSWKLGVVYALVIATIALADPSPGKWRRWSFEAGVGLLVLAVWIRLWAAGHLVKNKVLTVTGPYAHVKNPLYIGTFLGMVGFALCAMGPDLGPWFHRHFNWILLAAAILVFVLYYIPYKRRREGDRLREIFAEAWDHYDRAVPDYIPRLRRYERAGDRRWSWRVARENSEHWTPLAIAAGLAALVLNGRILDLIR